MGADIITAVEMVESVRTGESLIPEIVSSNLEELKFSV